MMYQAGHWTPIKRMHARTSRKWALTLGVLAATAVAVPAANAAEDPSNVVYSAEFQDGKIIKAGQTDLGKDAFGRAEIVKKDVKEDQGTPGGKIQPALLD